MIISTIILCTLLIIYTDIQIMSEIIKLRADVEFIKDDKSKQIIRELVNEKLAKEKQCQK